MTDLQTLVREAIREELLFYGYKPEDTPVESLSTDLSAAVMRALMKAAILPKPPPGGQFPPLRETAAFQSAVPCDDCGHARGVHFSDLGGCAGFQQCDPPRAGHLDRCRCGGYRTPEEYK